MDADLTQGFNQFAVDFFRDVYSDGHENLIVSSFSVIVAMLMTLTGSMGETSQEILKALGISKFVESNHYILANQPLHESISALLKSLNDMSSDKNRIVLANKMILNNIRASDSFLDIITNMYGAQVDTVTAQNSIQSIISQTNKWVSEMTANKINNILDENMHLTSLCLLNVIYFKSEWLYQFDENQTRQEKFYIEAHKQNNFVNVDMMQLKTNKIDYTFSENLKSHLIRLPYKGERFQFNILFPSDESDFLLPYDDQSLINRLDYDLIKSELENFHHEDLILKMPKFSTKNNLKLNNVLKKMGIESAFSESKANFKRISEFEKLFIDEVYQYSYVEVNEKGTEAAAATVVRVVKRSLGERTFKLITLDRPFVYFISEKSSNLILFFGTFIGFEDKRQDSDKIEANKKTFLSFKSDL